MGVLVLISHVAAYGRAFDRMQQNNSRHSLIRLKTGVI